MKMRARIVPPRGGKVVDEVGDVSSDGDLERLFNRTFERFHRENPDEPLVTNLTESNEVLTITMSKADDA